MKGVFIEDVDNDDYAGECYCVDSNDEVLFPATKIISDGSQNIENYQLKNCCSFGFKHDENDCDNNNGDDNDGDDNDDDDNHGDDNDSDDDENDGYDNDSYDDSISSSFIS